MKGRPKDPTRVRRRTGHRRKPDEGAIVRALPSPIVDPGPEPPEDFPDEGKEIWRRIVAVMRTNSPLRELDSFWLEATVRQYLRMRQSGSVVDQYGVVAKNVSGDVVVSPFVKAERDAAGMFLRLAEHGGLTLASRFRLGLMTLQAKTLGQALMEDLEG